MNTTPRRLGHDIALILILGGLWTFGDLGIRSGSPEYIVLLHMVAFVHLWFTMLLGNITGARKGLWIVLTLMICLDKTIGLHGFFPTGQMWGAALDTGLAPLDALLQSAPIDWLASLTTHLLAVVLIADITLMQWNSLQSASRNRLMGLGLAIIALVIAPGVLIQLIPMATADPDMAFQSIEDIMAEARITPTFIVPQAHVLPDYAALRAIPSKSGGVIAMFAFGLAPLLVLLFRAEQITSQNGRILWLCACLLYLPIIAGLGVLGAHPADGNALLYAQLLLALACAFFVMMPTLRQILSRT